METHPAPSANLIPIINSISALAEGRDVWLTDIWGVMHNGVAPFASACDACTRFRLAGGTVLLLSNAPRPAASVATQLDRIGVPRFAYDAIVTSGDAARTFLEPYSGRVVYPLGPERDLPLYEGLDVILGSAEDAVAISCTGLFDDEIEVPDDYAALLSGFAERKLPMVCANPDLTVERGDKIVYCAGALASAYERMGGSVKYAGKPYLPIYDMALAHIETLKSKAIARDRVLAIGDGIRTDIAGAVRAGIDSVFIASGVHVEGDGLTDAGLLKLFPGDNRPIAAMTALAW
jgi:HAD superfamily hydrolase (TIGR01459 family)